MMRSPVARSSLNLSTYDETSPPGSLTIRTSAEAALVKDDMMTTDASAPATTDCHFMNTLPD
jgi:hypothetical protein